VCKVIKDAEIFAAHSLRQLNHSGRQQSTFVQQSLQRPCRECTHSWLSELWNGRRCIYFVSGKTNKIKDKLGLAIGLCVPRSFLKIPSASPSLQVAFSWISPLFLWTWSFLIYFSVIPRFEVSIPFVSIQSGRHGRSWYSCGARGGLWAVLHEPNAWFLATKIQTNINMQPFQHK